MAAAKASSRKLPLGLPAGRGAGGGTDSDAARGTGTDTGDTGLNRDRNQNQDEPTGTGEGGTGGAPISGNRPPVGQRTQLFEPGNRSFTDQIAAAAGVFERDRAAIERAFMNHKPIQPHRAA